MILLGFLGVVLDKLLDVGLGELDLGVGRFLAMLAAGCISGRIGELGTGIGIGAA